VTDTDCTGTNYNTNTTTTAPGKTWQDKQTFSSPLLIRNKWYHKGNKY